MTHCALLLLGAVRLEHRDSTEKSDTRERNEVVHAWQERVKDACVSSVQVKPTLTSQLLVKIPIRMTVGEGLPLGFLP